jgi:hypothetical protein
MAGGEPSKKPSASGRRNTLELRAALAQAVKTAQNVKTAI